MTTKNDEWADAVEVNAQSSETWDQKTPLIGQFLGTKEHVGPNESNMHNVRTDEGDVVGAWGSTVLDGKMAQVKVGSRVKIVFLGVETNPKSNRSYKNYSVLVKAPETPVVPDAEETLNLDDIPFGE